MSSKHRKAFEDLAQESKEELGNSLKKLVLYGSVARGEETEESDLDVFGVVEDENHKKWLEQRAAEIGVDHSVLISANIKTEREYQDAIDTEYVKEVISTGEAYV
jgi:predicted nucleotidyltransferase